MTGHAESPIFEDLRRADKHCLDLVAVELARCGFPQMLLEMVGQWHSAFCLETVSEETT